MNWNKPYMGDWMPGRILAGVLGLVAIGSFIYLVIVIVSRFTAT